MKILLMLILVVGLNCVAFGQEKAPAKKKATDADKVATFDKDGEIKRGAMLADAEKVELKDVLAKPADFKDKTVRVEGVVVRSCKKEGCWAVLAPAKDSETSVRVTMKDHQFFVPLKSVGFKAVAEGVFKVKTLSKEHVDHLIKDDGMKFKNRNADGTVTEVAFVASGIVLTKEAN